MCFESRYLLKVISSVFFTEHLKDVFECGVWGHLYGLQKYSWEKLCQWLFKIDW